MMDNASLSCRLEGTVQRPRTFVDYEKVFLSQLPVIEKVIANVCRRHHLPETEIEEFASAVKLHLIESDYDALRRFQHSSSLRTYLIVVIRRRFLNYRNGIWGRWRPSSEAQRAGPVGILMERLLARDGWSFEEALEQMRSNYKVQEHISELRALATRLSLDPSARRFVSDDLAEGVAGHDVGPEGNLLRAEQERIDHSIRTTLDRALQSLTAQERILLRMRFEDGFTVAQIAKTLHVKQKPLYRTIERLLSCLRERLIADGISTRDVHALLAEYGAAPSSIIPVTRSQGREGSRG
jgi:RNA polymerase sigma factor for flagellar operon FliA